MKKNTILVTGANGQIGTVLVQALADRYGSERILATDIRDAGTSSCPFAILDIMDKELLGKLVREYQVTQIYHLAAILSAKGEQMPRQTWDVNMNGFFNILDVSLEAGVEKVFFPSSIAVFGADTPRIHTPQQTYMAPTTVYGISKVSGELWSQYYHDRYGLDVRSLRYPGIIGYQSLPGGGTTDYAVDIYHKAVKGQPFNCFLKPHTMLPMIYMEDAIRATLELMEAPEKNIRVRTSYNLSGMSFTPAQIAAEITKLLPEFSIEYDPDPLKQGIADSWSDTIDDSQAREDWGWKPAYDLKAMTEDMVRNLQKVYAQEKELTN